MCERAWIHVKADVSNLQDAAEKIYLLNRDFNISDGFIIRADVVRVDSEKPYNIVVPVNAKDMDAIKAAINKLDNIEVIHTATVTNHYPEIPHLAKGFVTEEEFFWSNPGGRPGTRKDNAWG